MLVADLAASQSLSTPTTKAFHICQLFVQSCLRSLLVILTAVTQQTASASSAAKPPIVPANMVVVAFCVVSLRLGDDGSAAAELQHASLQRVQQLSVCLVALLRRYVEGDVEGFRVSFHQCTVDVMCTALRSPLRKLSRLCPVCQDTVVQTHLCRHLCLYC